MQHGAVVGQVVVTVEQHAQVVGVEHRLAGDGAQAVEAEGPHVGVGADQDADVAVELLELADAALRAR